MLSLQPYSLWFTVCVPVLSSRFLSSCLTPAAQHAHLTTWRRTQKIINHFYSIFSLGIKSMSSDQRRTGNPLKLDSSLSEEMNGKVEERFQCWRIALSKLSSALHFLFSNDPTNKRRWQLVIMTGTFDPRAPAAKQPAQHRASSSYCKKTQCSLGNWVNYFWRTDTGCIGFGMMSAVVGLE